MYQDFYGLSEMPFNVTPNPKFLFLSPSHQEALSHLRYGIEEKKGFIVLTGEVGCGKTTLCRALLNELEERNCETILILNPRLNEEQLIVNILRELGEPIPTNTASLMGELNEVLLKRIHSGKELVMIIDEAQQLSFEVMEQIRLLSNLETDEQKLMQIIMLGQPELKAKLREERLRQLKQRVLVYYDLRPLRLEETQYYIRHRIQLAGGKGKPEFSPRAIRRIFKHTRGTPRLINNLCDKSLLSAYVRDSNIVNYWDVRKAIKDNII